MISGVRQSISGMTERAKAQEVVANNLANIQTTGYKAERLSFAQLLDRSIAPGRPAGTPLDAGAATPRTIAPNTAPGAVANGAAGISRQSSTAAPVTQLRTSIDLRPGSIRQTGNDLDLAIDGKGFFVVQTPQGERYTRGGSFMLNGSGQLVTRDGFPILTEGGPINAEGGRIMVGGDGMVSVGGQAVGKLRVAVFNGPGDVTRAAGGLYTANGTPKAEEDARVAQGYLEDANVNPIEMLTEMIDTMRGFESNQRALREQLDSLEKLVSEAGR